MKIIDSKCIGKKIKSRRKELGLTQENLGELLNVSFQQIQKYEKGINKLSPEKFQMMAHALSVPIEFFLRGDDSEKNLIVKEPRLVYNTKILSLDEQELLRNYRNLKKRDSKKLALSLLKAVSKHIDKSD